MRTPALIGLALACLATGCGGGDTAEVHGTVKLNGETIQEGAITFIPVEGTKGAGTGAAIREGRYHVPASKGAAVGKNRVELRAFRNTGRKVKDPTGPPGAMTDERVPAFPPEYNDRSKLIHDIKPGSNKIDFNIELPKK